MIARSAFAHRGGFYAFVENFAGEQAVVETTSGTAADACRLAAIELRAAADRFDALATEAQPTHGPTQDRVNALAST